MKKRANALLHADVQRILAERAEALARSDDDIDAGEVRPVVVLAVAGEAYGIDLAKVREIAPIGAFTTVPSLPDHWLGLVNLRGRLFPLLDLRTYLGLSPAASGIDRWMALVGSSQYAIALAVDEVRQVRSVPVATIGPPLTNGSLATSVVHVGLTSDLLSILDVEAILGDPGLVVDVA